MTAPEQLTHHFAAAARSIAHQPHYNPDGSFNMTNALANANNYCRALDTLFSSNRAYFTNGEAVEFPLPAFPAEAIDTHTLFERLTQEYQFLNLALLCRVNHAALHLTIHQNDTLLTPTITVNPKQDWYDSNVAFATCCGRSCCRLGEQKRAWKQQHTQHTAPSP